MNTEKQITITDLRGKFTKDFDTFGKMDPFIEFAVGKYSGRTETASGAGKQPAWKNSVVLTYFDQSFISIKAYDQDATQNQYIGTGKIEVKSLRFPGGAIEININTDSGENVGTINGKYTIKNLNPTPLMLIKNMRCNFVKQNDLILKSKPYLRFKTDDHTVSTQAKQQDLGLTVSWAQSLRLRIKQNSAIQISMRDKNTENAFIFKYQCLAKEFRLQNGSKKFNVFDSNYFYLGVVEFDFETVNLVSKEESVKNAQKQKKSDSELTSIMIDKVKTELKKGKKDIYYHFVAGTNKIETAVVKSVPQTSQLDVKKVAYADSKENKLLVLVWEKNLLKDEVIGWASIPLDGLSSGDKKVALLDLNGKIETGSITLSLDVKQVPCKIINLDNIVVEFTEGGDMIGESEPYVVAKLGGASNRTQTGDKNKFQFKRGIELKYSDEDSLQFELWDEDVTNDELIFLEKIKISELKGLKGDFILKLTKNGQTKPSDKAKLSFRYQIKGSITQTIPKKQSQKKPDPPKAQQKKKQEQVKPVQKEAPKQPEVKPQVKAQVKPQVKQQVRVQVKPKQQIKQQKKPEPQKTEQPKSMQTISHGQNTERQKLNSKKSEHNLTEENKSQSMNKNPKQSRKGQSIILPSIIASHLNYGDKIFDKQSAATLQKSIVAYSMPKANRFTDEPKYSGQPSYCVDSCFKSSSTKGVGFGFGRKKQFPDWMQRNMKENPPPGAYIDTTKNPNSKGPTFGISHKYYEKVLIAKQKQTHIPTKRKLSPIKEKGY